MNDNDQVTESDLREYLDSFKGRVKATKGLALFREQLDAGLKKPIPVECEFDVVSKVGQSCLFKDPSLWINAFQDARSPFL
jgi:hypothetical protein